MNASDLLKTINQAGQQDVYPSKIATVTSTSSSGVYLKFYGETTASQKPYKRVSTYSPNVGDKVMVANINNSYVVMGAIV